MAVYGTQQYFDSLNKLSPQAINQAIYANQLAKSNQRRLPSAEEAAIQSELYNAQLAKMKGLTLPSTTNLTIGKNESDLRLLPSNEAKTLASNEYLADDYTRKKAIAPNKYASDASTYDYNTKVNPYKADADVASYNLSKDQNIFKKNVLGTQNYNDYGKVEQLGIDKTIREEEDAAEIDKEVSTVERVIQPYYRNLFEGKGDIAKSIEIVASTYPNKIEVFNKIYRANKKLPEGTPVNPSDLSMFIKENADKYNSTKTDKSISPEIKSEIDIISNGMSPLDKTYLEEVMTKTGADARSVGIVKYLSSKYPEKMAGINSLYDQIIQYSGKGKRTITSDTGTIDNTIANAVNKIGEGMQPEDKIILNEVVNDKGSENTKLGKMKYLGDKYKDKAGYLNELYKYIIDVKNSGKASDKGIVPNRKLSTSEIGAINSLNDKIKSVAYMASQPNFEVGLVEYDDMRLFLENALRSGVSIGDAIKQYYLREVKRYGLGSNSSPQPKNKSGLSDRATEILQKIQKDSSKKAEDTRVSNLVNNVPFSNVGNVPDETKNMMENFRKQGKIRYSGTSETDPAIKYIEEESERKRLEDERKRLEDERIGYEEIPQIYGSQVPRLIRY